MRAERPRERLQILLAHERGSRGQPDLLWQLREEILAAVSRHMTIDPDKVQVRMDRGKTVSTLAVDIELPDAFGGSIQAAGQAAESCLISMRYGRILKNQYRLSRTDDFVCPRIIPNQAIKQRI